MNRLFDQRRYLIPFRSGLLPQIFTDTLVIGGGVAGLRAAVAAAGGDKERHGVSPAGDVIVLSKTDFDSTNTAWAQGGVAAVLKDTDSAAAHEQDTLTAGAGLCDAGAVRRVVAEGPRRVRELIEWGMAFDADAAEPHGLAVGREGGHGVGRVYHAGGDATGRSLQATLLRRIREVQRRSNNLRVFDGCFALDLVTPSLEVGAPVLGAITFHPRYGLQMIWARTTILASGGAGQVYRETTNPKGATADGLAMAFRAGATLADMSFVQFHPTTLYLPGTQRSLLTEAIRGEGAHLLDASGRRFMVDLHPQAELAPRDVVAAAIVQQRARQGGLPVHLDCRHVSGFAERFPGIARTLERFGLDPSVDLVPVYPAAHYTIGGVRTGDDGASSVPNLYAVGEASCSGLNGANRLASNSLLEGLVLGHAAGVAAAERASAGQPVTPVSVNSEIPSADGGELDLADVRSSLRSAMWMNVGLERHASRLHDAEDMFDFWGRYTMGRVFDEPWGWETQNMLLVGAIITRSASWREESRGTHRRLDAPEPVAGFAVHDLIRRGDSEIRTEPVGEVGKVAS